MPKTPRAVFLLMLWVLLLASCDRASPEANPAEEATPAPAGIIERDVTYCTMEGVALKMDLYYPLAGEGPWPVVMYVHGGGWVNGNKNSGVGMRDIPSLQHAGFLVVSANYRLAPEHKFPAMIEDLKCAVRYLRAHAADYNLDPDRIGAWGSSAGGHLVSLLATADESAGWETGEYLDQSSRVVAVVDMFGPADLTLFSSDERVQRRNARVFGAAKLDTAPLIAASPVNHVTPDDAPFLIFHGEADTIVPPEHSQTLYAALQAAGVPATLVMVQNAGHSFIPVGGLPEPSREEITLMLVSFFNQWLNPIPVW